MSIRLYVGNLPKADVEREQLETFFADAGELVSVKPIKDRKTGKCRGFAFVTVETDEQADAIVEKYNGMMFQEQPVKIEKALPKAKGQEDEDGDGDEASSATKANAGNKGANANGGSRRSGGKKGGRKDGNKSGSGNVYSSNTSAESFQPDPRWAGKLAELKDKLAQSGNL